MNNRAIEEVKEQEAHDRTRNGIVYGCYCDLDSEPNGTLPDQCVIHDGRKLSHCVYTKGLMDKGKDKWDCPYWKPMPIAEKETGEVSFLLELHQLLAKYNALLMVNHKHQDDVEDFMEIYLQDTQTLIEVGDLLDVDGCQELLQKELSKRDA